MVSDPFLVGALFGFLPAMGFLYILLHQYQDFFNEKRVFKTFLFGIIAGLLVWFIENFLGPGSIGTSDAWRAPLYGGLFAVLEVLVAMAVLNWRTFRGRRDTPYYGAALGLGFAAMNTLFVIGGVVAAIDLDTGGWAALASLILIGILFIASILVHAGAFVWVGLATTSGRLVHWGGRAFVALFAISVLQVGLNVVPPAWQPAIPIVAIVGAVVFIWHILRSVLDAIVPDEVLREAGIHRRRMARRILRQGDGSQDAEGAGPGLEDDAVGDEPRQ